VDLTQLPLNPVAATVVYSGTAGVFTVSSTALRTAGNYTPQASFYLLGQGTRRVLPSDPPHPQAPVVTIQPGPPADGALAFAGSACSPAVAADSVHQLYVTLRDRFHNVIIAPALLAAAAARATVLVRGEGQVGGGLAPVVVTVTPAGGLYAAYEVSTLPLPRRLSRPA
jgi:hypothetical protein